MKQPKWPDNPLFWISVIKDPMEIKKFIEKGTELQKRNLKRAIALAKWKKLREQEIISSLKKKEK